MKGNTAHHTPPSLPSQYTTYKSPSHDTRTPELAHEPFTTVVLYTFSQCLRRLRPSALFGMLAHAATRRPPWLRCPITSSTAPCQLQRISTAPLYQSHRRRGTLAVHHSLLDPRSPSPAVVMATVAAAAAATVWHRLCRRRCCSYSVDRVWAVGAAAQVRRVAVGS